MALRDAPGRRSPASFAIRLASLGNRILGSVDGAIADCWDRRLGITTAFVAEPEAVAAVPREVVEQARRYQSARPGRTLRALRAVRARCPRGCFVDLGSGAGRVLVLAAHAGFDELLGVEFDPSLAEQSRRNLASFRRPRGRSPDRMEVLVGDAGAVDLPEPVAVVYMFNPFREGVLRGFIGRNRERLSHSGACFLYQSPICEDVLLEEGYRVAAEWPHRDFHQVIRYYAPQARPPRPLPASEH